MLVEEPLSRLPPQSSVIEKRNVLIVSINTASSASEIKVSSSVKPRLGRAAFIG